VEMKDALIVTFLGIAVVFSGLIMTSMMISAFSFFPRMAQKIKNALSRPQPQPAESPVETVDHRIEVSPDIVAVISAVIEAENRIRWASAASKFTFRQER